MKRCVKTPEGEICYFLLQSKARQDFLLQPLPRKVVKLYAPARATLKQADALIYQRAGWIRKMQQTLEQIQKEPVFDAQNGVLLEGKRVSLQPRPLLAEKIRWENGCLWYSDSLNAQTLTLALEEFLCRLALERVKQALTKYAPSVGVPFGRVTLRNQKSRWGSCSSKHNLNFNWRLIFAPPEALEYVVLHELCHLLVFNHSAQFWREVEKRMPEYAHWKKWLRENGKNLHF